MNETPNVTPETAAAETITPLVVDPSRLRCPACASHPRLVVPSGPPAPGSLVCPTEGCAFSIVGAYTMDAATRAAASYIVALGGAAAYEGRIKVYPHAGRAFKHALSVASRFPGQKFEVVKYDSGEIVGAVLVPVKPVEVEAPVAEPTPSAQ